ncbi:MAG: hypothetical protein K2Y22_15920 [Candidatus Obscuribacterales bacterium]|nr:hypothetical protein [Candidatus Obscuribacterales bacterium]
MSRIVKILTAGIASFGCVFMVSCSTPLDKTTLELTPLPTIRADQAHQIDVDKHTNLIYEVPPGQGFVLDTSEYKIEYARAGSGKPFLAKVKVIRLDPVALNHAAPVSVELSAGRDLYTICPNVGLRSGDKFIVQMAKEVPDQEHYYVYQFWAAYVRVK